MNRLILTVLISMLTAWSPLMCQKVHDFDSLIQSNPYLEPLLKFAADTFQLFGPEEPLEFTVLTDFKALAKNKFKDEYQDATVMFDVTDTLRITRVVRVKPRGEFRLKNCRYAPLRVNVKKTQEVFDVLDHLDKLKLVVPCSSSDSYQQYIFKEFLAYKLYNIITDCSFKVRLIKVNLKDTGGKVQQQYSYTFLIEDEESLAKRLQAIPLDNERINANSTDVNFASLMYVFQYMIGNTDWSVPGLHNVKLFKEQDPLKPYPMPVPYDFDYCGLVDAVYAIPGNHVNIDRVTDRVYMGYCVPDEELEKAVQVFREKESELMDVIKDFPHLGNSDRKIALNYLERFYGVINDPKRFNSQIAQVCKE